MNFLRKLFDRGAVPEWAAFLSPDDYAAFRTALQAELTAQGLAHRLDARAGTVTIPREGEPAQLGLQNLAQVCGQVAREEWPAVIRRHLEIILVGSPASTELLDALAGDYERAREVLKVRLYPAGYGGEVPLVSEPVADDLVAVLVYDLPDSIATVHGDHADGWGVSRHDLIQTGLRNVLAAGRLSAEPLKIDGGITLFSYGDTANYYAASHALLLHEYLDPQPELGALVSVPHRHLMLVHPIVDQRLLGALNAFLVITPELFEEGPGSITPSIYWHHHGHFTRLPYERKKDRKVTFFPPLAFQEQVLERLPASADPSETA
jgi:hypothetical protein